MIIKLSLCYMYTSLCAMYLNMYAAKCSEAFVNRSNSTEGTRDAVTNFAEVSKNLIKYQI